MNMNKEGLGKRDIKETILLSMMTQLVDNWKNTFMETAQTYTHTPRLSLLNIQGHFLNSIPDILCWNWMFQKWQPKLGDPTHLISESLPSIVRPPWWLTSITPTSHF